MKETDFRDVVKFCYVIPREAFCDSVIASVNIAQDEEGFYLRIPITEMGVDSFRLSVLGKVRKIVFIDRDKENRVIAKEIGKRKGVVE